VELRAGAAKLSSVSRRFREFLELHSQLCKFRHPFPIPDVPPKRFFGSTSPEFVAQRQTELQKFLDQLVTNIVENPPAEAAWKLLCLFLALDPKQYVPESILNLADQSGVVDDLETTDSARAQTSAQSGVQRRNTAEASANATESKNAVESSTETDGFVDSQGLDAEERKRMDRIVEEFQKQTINVGKNTEERLQGPDAGFLKRIPLNKLAESIREHILSNPLLQTTNLSEKASVVANGNLFGADEVVIQLDEQQ